MKRDRVFKQESVLIEMLNLRRRGYTYDELAERYKVDRTSIKHWCDLYGLGGNIIIIVRHYYESNGISKPRKVKTEKSIWIDDKIEGKICRGKSYAEYLENNKHNNERI